MQKNELLTLPLSKRIEALRRQAGSHDKLAAELGTTRQTIINWEKRNAQPSSVYRQKLADYSGLTPDDFKHSVVEQAVWALTERRLRRLEGRVDHLFRYTARGFEALGLQQHGLGGPEADLDQEPQL